MALVNSSLTKKMRARTDGDSVAAIFTVAMIYAICVWIYETKQLSYEPAMWLYSAGFAVYTFCFFCSTTSNASQRFRLASLVLMLITAFMLLFIMHFDFLSILTIIWVAVMANFVSMRIALVIAIIVVASWFLVASWLQNEALWIQAMLFATFHMFALLLSKANQRTNKINEELKQKNDELIATQDMLDQFSRQSERTRIAREIHDIVGHQMTALTIKLQVASRLSQGEAKQHIDECHSVSKQLLSDVRTAVASIRDSQPIDFAQSLRLLVQNTPLKVNIEIEDDISIEDSTLAFTLFRCIQEATTNSLKHGSATQITIRVYENERGINTNIYDDGKLKPNWQEGNGLIGMRERVNLLGGKIIFEEKNNAMHYEISLPKARTSQ